MNRITHRKFSVGFGYVAIALMYMYDMLDINYYEAFVIIITVSQIGAKFPDYDHVWKNIGDKDAIKFLINKIIHITGGKHRSRHTHSIDIFVAASICMLWLNKYIFEAGVNYSIGKTIIVGFICGWASHLFADSLTLDGVYLLFWANIKVRIVPKKISKILFVLIGIAVIGYGLFSDIIMKQEYGLVVALVGTLILVLAIRFGGMKFKTGDEWEQIVQRSLILVNVSLGIGAFIFPVLLALKNGITTMPDIINILIK